MSLSEELANNYYPRHGMLTRYRTHVYDELIFIKEKLQTLFNMVGNCGGDAVSPSYGVATASNRDYGEAKMGADYTTEETRLIKRTVDNNALVASYMCINKAGHPYAYGGQWNAARYRDSHGNFITSIQEQVVLIRWYMHALEALIVKWDADNNVILPKDEDAVYSEFFYKYCTGDNNSRQEACNGRRTSSIKLEGDENLI